MLSLALITDAQAPPTETPSLAVVMRVRSMRLSKRQQCARRKTTAPLSAPRRTECAPTVPPAPQSLRIEGYAPIDVASDGTCRTTDVMALISDMAVAAGGSAAPFEAAWHECSMHAADGRIGFEFVVERLRDLPDAATDAQGAWR